jgi:hypothetical protein
VLYEYRDSLKWYLGLNKIELPPPDEPLNQQEEKSGK